MMLTQLSKEIDRLNQELTDQRDKNLKLWVKMLDMVPKRDHEAAIGSMKVCQNTIETLMVELREWDPANRAAADASIILGGLEAIITPDLIKGDYNFANGPIFGTVKKEYKP